MTCPTCQSKTQVIDSRETSEGIRRRRVCEQGHRFSTLEWLAASLCETGNYGFGSLGKARAAIKRRGGEWRAHPCDYCDAWHLTPVEKTDTSFQQT
jgi:hypothetical protein